MALLSHSAMAAKTVVGQIVGAYDDGCSSISCLPGSPSGITAFATNGGTPGDSPNLFIYNSGDNPMTFSSILLTGYQGLNNGTSFEVTGSQGLNGSLTVGAHTAYRLTWGTQSTSAGNMFAYDYDDEYGATATTNGGLGPTTNGTAFSGGGAVSGPVCTDVGSAICADVGNFDVAMSGTLNSNPISADFSPAQNLPGFGNLSGGFNGWIGLSPAGWSESTYDQHTGTTPGVMADIFTGTSGAQNVPEPASLLTLSAALGALGLVRRKRKQR